MPKNQTLTLGAVDLCDMIGITPRRLTSLVDQGIVRKSGRGLYDLKASVRGYCSYLRGSRTGGSSENDDRGRLMAAKADMAEMEAKAMSGDLVSVAAVTADWVDKTVRFRQRVRSAPVKLAPMVVTIDDEAEAAELILSVIDEALSELGDDEVYYEEPVADSGASGGESGGSPSAEDDDLGMG